MKYRRDLCPENKVGFDYVWSAMKALQTIIAEKDGRPKPFRVYKCHRCSKYHLTSQDDRRKLAVNPFRCE